MLTTTKGIVLRSVKYSESSLISTIFTEKFGVQSYLARGVRKNKTNSASLLQTSALITIETSHHPHKNLQHFRNIQRALPQNSLHENILKNSIAIFASEVLLRLLPENAPLQDMFDFSFNFFSLLDKEENIPLANFPLYFIIHIGNLAGYRIQGDFSSSTPYINMQDGNFTKETIPFSTLPAFHSEKLYQLLQTGYHQLIQINLPSKIRSEILEWYIEFIRTHSQHMGEIKSLKVLQAILH